MTNRDMAQLALQTHEIYQRRAARFDAERAKHLHERAWLDRWLKAVPQHGSLLDLGCGAGDPIARDLLARGYRVTGLDFSSAMLDLARARFPKACWVHADMRSLDLDQLFDGILGWNSFFHLRPGEQRALLPRIVRHLAPGGSLMLTVGDEAGEVVGQVGGEPVYHASLHLHGYLRILNLCGMQLDALVVEDETCDYQTVLLAHKRA